MQKLIQIFQKKNHLDIIRIVDISSLTLQENRGYSYAILLAKILPKEYIYRLHHEKEVDYTTFSNYEQTTDALADKLAIEIQKEGYKAISQSENGIDSRGECDEKFKSTLLPHKKIAMMSGLGWIGRNNLLITENYGAALSMCSVLTNMPLEPIKTEMILSGRCENCDRCVKICPTQAIYGKRWKPGISRDEIIDVNRCIACLQCFAGCRYSIAYAKSSN